MKEFATKLLEQLYADIEPVKEAYTNDSFAYVASRMLGGMVLVQGSLLLNVLPRDYPQTFNTANIRAGHFPLSEIGLDRRAFMDKAIQGVIPTPEGNLLFPGNSPGEYAGSYVPFHQYGAQTQSRLGLLTLIGHQTFEYLDQPRVDWELRAGSIPYDGIAELLYEYQLGALRQGAGIEIAAFAVASIDASSRIQGETAKIVINAASGIDPSKIGLGLRIFDQGKIIKRERISGSAFKWSPIGGRQVGEIEFPVPRAAVIHGVVSYKEHAQQYYWVSDPDTFQNPRRASYESSDRGAAILMDIIAKAEGKGSNADNFEAGISWLFWMLGFSPALLSASTRTTDASDILLCTPTGHYAVVEVTTGLPKTERKMPNLDVRAQAVRRMLDASNNKHLRVLPVLVTSKTREEVKSELADTEKLGIYLITKEGIEALVTRTLLPLNPEQLYEDAEREARDAKAKYNPDLFEDGGA